MTDREALTERMREAYILAAGGMLKAVEYEGIVLSADPRHLPACAIAVLLGGEPTLEYWRFLSQQLVLVNIQAMAEAFAKDKP